MTDPILQSRLPEDQRAAAAARLPAMQALRPGDWLRIDDAHAAQLALKRTLLATRRDAVLRLLPGAEAAADELLEAVLDALALHPDATLTGDALRVRGGEEVVPDRADPLGTLARLVQEDFCILQKTGEEHVLTAALLCFPASWTLAEKIGRPLRRIHAPVAPYDEGIATRVQRLFDGVRPGRPLWRANLLGYDLPDLYQPHSEAAPRKPRSAAPPWLRSERQCVLRLPRSGAEVFSIHTTVIRAPVGAAAAYGGEATG